jgi:hypothetical protein
MITSRISFEACSTGPDLMLTVWFDGEKIWQSCPGRVPLVIQHEFSDSDDKHHVLELELSGKIPEHTKINEDGSILEDRCLRIQKLSLDDIELGYLLTTTAAYHHDFNGTGQPVIEKFYGDMGCNGRVKFEFTSPVYLWLLENL